MTKKRTGRERENPLRAIGDITEHKRAEEALRESEERYRTLVETARDVIYTVSADAIFLSLNPAFETVTGWSSAEWLGRPFADIIHPDDLAAGMENFRRILQGEVPPISEIRILTKSGEYLTGEFAARSLFAHGKVVGAFGIVRDITDRKRAEEALRESEERYRDLVENINDIIYEVDATGRVTYISPVVEEVGGYSPSEIVGRSWMEFLHPDDHSTAIEDFRRNVSGDIEPHEHRLVGKSGETHWVHSFGRPILDGERIVGMRGVLTIITDRKRAEEALRESEERYRDLAENLNDAIFEFDTSGRWTYVNPGMEEVSGHSASEMIGSFVTDFVHPDDLPAVMDRIRKRPFGDREPSEYRLLRKSGEARWVRSLGGPMFEGHRVVGFRAVLTDITERKLAEEALRQSEERWRSITESSPDYIMLLDRDGTILFINRTVPDLTRDEVIGTTVYDHVPPEFHKVAADCFEGVWESGQPGAYSTQYRTKEGEVRFFDVRVGPVLESGQVVALVSSSTDITERKQAEQALRESEERWRSLAENAPDIIMTVDADGTILFINRVVPGLAVESVIGTSLDDYVPPEHRDRQRRALERVFETGEPLSYEIAGTGPHGSTSWYFSRIGPVKRGDKVVAAILITTDITEERQAEEALRQSENRYRTLVEAAPDVIYALALDGTVTSLNSAFESLSGWSRDDWLGKHFAPIIHPDDLPAVIEDFRLVLQGKVPPVGEYRMLTESGHYLPVETVPRPLIVDGEVVGTLGIARDLTPRKEMEETLQKVREELESKVERQMLRQNPYGFSFREFTVLYLVTAGQSDREIGITLGISPVTAQKHVENIRAKMKAATRIEASVRALREGLLG